MVKTNEKFNAVGIWEITLVDKKTGNVLEKEIRKNMIVASGLERIAKLINGVNTKYFDYIAIGTGNTAVEETDLTLESEYSRAQATTYFEEPNKACWEHLFLFDSATTIREAGVFDELTASGSVMMNRVVFTDKNVDENTGINMKFTLIANRG